MATSKGGREKIKLESTAGTGHFYTTSKNKKTMPEKMSIMKPLDVAMTSRMSWLTMVSKMIGRTPSRSAAAGG